MKISRNGQWRPAGTIRDFGINRKRRPDVGDVVAYDHRAWEVTHIRLDDYDEESQARANLYRPQFRNDYRGYHISLRRLHGPKHHRENSRQEIALSVHAFSHWRFKRYDEGRVPLCSCCQAPWPCIQTVAKYESELAAEGLEKRMARAGVGLCYACGEVITARQKSAEYGNGNVDLPGYPTPRFHLRESCRYERVSYMDRLMKAQGDEVVTGAVDNGLWGDR